MHILEYTILDNNISLGNSLENCLNELPLNLLNIHHQIRSLYLSNYIPKSSTYKPTIYRIYRC